MSIVNFFMEPKVVLVLFTLFLVGYLIFLDEEGAFSASFLQFGPGKGTFLGIKLDTWPKVLTLYGVGFFTSLMTSYYQWIMSNNIHSYVYNRAISEVPYSRFWIYLINILEPFFYQILAVIQFFTTLTMQLQFILPQFIGSLVADMPFTLQRLGEKKYAEL
jgi:hypothetical protein